MLIETALVGVWSGYIIQSIPSMVFLHFIVAGDRMFGYLDVLGQNIKGFGIDNSIYLNNGAIKFNISKLKSSYDGSLNGTNMNGFWISNGYRFRLDLEKTQNISEYSIDHRPQTPIGPFKYIEEEVTFYNKKTNIALSGTLTYPKDYKPLATVILAHGSNGQDRDQTMSGHRVFFVLADYLTNNGIAVLRFDERGIGQSSGNFTAATANDFAEDVIAGIDYLRHKEETKCSKIGVIGHGKGGLISMIVAKRKEVKFAVLLASSGLVGEESLLLQLRLNLEAQNFDNKTIGLTLNVTSEVYQILKKESDELVVKEKVIEFMEDFIDNLSEEEKPFFEKIKNDILQQLPDLCQPWFRDSLVFEPKSYLSRIKIPVFGIWGSKDLAVPPKENVPGVEEGLKLAYNRNFEIVTIDGLNHLFQNSTTGAPSEYETIKETFSPVALKMISNWISKILLYL